MLFWSRMEIYPYAKALPLDLHDVKITGGFWHEKIEKSRAVGLPRLLSQYEERNILKKFVAVAQNQPRDDKENGHNYDEFLFKALEAAAYYLGNTETRNGTNEDEQDQASWLRELKSQFIRIRDIVLSAQQPDGYLNTLAVSTGTEHQRNEFIGCSCCPPNVQRLFASLQQYIYAVKDDTIWVNLFIGSEMKFQIPDGPHVSLNQQTEYLRGRRYLYFNRNRRRAKRGVLNQSSYSRVVRRCRNENKPGGIGSRKQAIQRPVQAGVLCRN